MVGCFHKPRSISSNSVGCSTLPFTKPFLYEFDRLTLNRQMLCRFELDQQHLINRIHLRAKPSRFLPKRRQSSFYIGRALRHSITTGKAQTQDKATRSQLLLRVLNPAARAMIGRYIIRTGQSSFSFHPFSQTKSLMGNELHTLFLI